MPDFFYVDCCYNCQHWHPEDGEGRFEGKCYQWSDCEETTTECNDCCCDWLGE